MHDSDIIRDYDDNLPSERMRNARRAAGYLSSAGMRAAHVRVAIATAMAIACISPARHRHARA